MIGRQPPRPGGRFVAPIHPKALCYQLLLRPPHVGCKRRQILLQTAYPLILAASRLLRSIGICQLRNSDDVQLMGRPVDAEGAIECESKIKEQKRSAGTQITFLFDLRSSLRCSGPFRELNEKIERTRGYGPFGG
jgi:hypothetical protein